MGSFDYILIPYQLPTFFGMFFTDIVFVVHKKPRHHIVASIFGMALVVGILGSL